VSFEPVWTSVTVHSSCGSIPGFNFSAIDDWVEYYPLSQILFMRPIGCLYIKSFQVNSRYFKKREGFIVWVDMCCFIT